MLNCASFKRASGSVAVNVLEQEVGVPGVRVEGNKLTKKLNLD